jgi:hypothetical protein
MSEERCETCRFWMPDRHHKTLGDCRRYPPISPSATPFPSEIPVFWWCGEYQPKTKTEDK